MRRLGSQQRQQVGVPWLTRTLIADGLLHYSYNEVAFMALNQVRAGQCNLPAEGSF